MMSESFAKGRPELIAPQTEIGRGIRSFLGKIKKEPISRLRARYVSLFDFSEKTTLDLTFHMFGEERDRSQKAQRGSALLLLKSIYSESGFEPTNSDLSDYLPTVLEFVSMAPKDQAVKVAKLIMEPLLVLERHVKASTEGEAGGYAPLLEACVAALNQFISVADNAHGRKESTGARE